MGDVWLSAYESCSRLGQEIMEKVTERNRLPKGTPSHVKLSAHIRGDMTHFSGQVDKLRQDLMRLSSQNRMSQREADRRQTMLDQLVTRERHIQQALKQEDVSGQRSALLGSGNPFEDDPWGTPAQTAPTPTSSIGEVRQQQQQVIREQDAGLDVLATVIGRQKQMALDIGNEVDGQNELIDDITDHVDLTDHRLIRETRHIRLIDRKSSTCWMWVVAIFLFIGIVVIAVVPYKGKP